MIFTRDEYRAIIRCLHPDARPSEAQRAEAFRLMREHKAKLIKPPAPQWQRPTPYTAEEQAKMRATREKRSQASKAAWAKRRDEAAAKAVG